MAFKSVSTATSAPDSPEKLILELPRRKIKGVLLHQGEVLKAYAERGVDVGDLALQLPTGSGKTLVGLMIAEWRRRKFNEKVLYLCPTKQLVNQVVEQAEDSYGLSLDGFTGEKSSYDPQAKARYQSGDRVAVTTYSSLFNSNPYFVSPDVIIVDDAHSAENYVAELWSLRISRDEHSVLHQAVASVLKPQLSNTDFGRLMGTMDALSDFGWSDKLSSPQLDEIHDQLVAVVDAHVGGSNLRFSWSMIKGHLRACHLYMSSEDILIRPLIAPTWTHAPFSNAKQRVFMSATLGAGGDLERLTGRENILRLPVPDGWDRQGIGRRLFIFPEMSLNDVETSDLRIRLMEKANRSLVLVPNGIKRDAVISEVSTKLGFRVFSASDIETSKKEFVNSSQAVAVVANRYDGIDFPGADCRLLFIDGLPRAVNTQERFLMSRMGANLLFQERVQTRVLQAIGRCTRSLEDYSAVVVTGSGLPDYLTDRKRRSQFHPELQAELEFGIEQSKKVRAEDILDNFALLIANGKEWEQANDQILTLRNASTQVQSPALSELQSVVAFEIRYEKAMWSEDFELALSFAEQVVTGLKSEGLRGYRALWHYLAGAAAQFSSLAQNDSFQKKARAHFTEAKKAAIGIPWLVRLSRFELGNELGGPNNSDAFDQIERVEAIFERAGTLHDRNYAKIEKEILDGLASTKSGVFEAAHRRLGEVLGYSSYKQESDASPDPYWISSGHCVVFEDHAGASAKSTLDATKARQVATHQNWIRANVPEGERLDIVCVLVTPVKKAESGALPHLTNVYLWPLDDFKTWAKNALTELRELRRMFVESGDLEWRSRALEIFETHSLDMQSLLKKIKKRTASGELSNR